MGQYLSEIAERAYFSTPQVNLTTRQLDTLSVEAYLVIDNFLEQSFFKALQFEAQEIVKYRDAQIVSGLKPKIRSDSITWIERSNPKLIYGNTYLNLLDTLSNQLNAHFFAGIRRAEAHFAHYGKGDFYKRHIDNPIGTQNRVFSCALYLNDNWQTDEGGELVIYEKDKPDTPSTTTLDTLLPLGNRMVIFDSMLPHEVKYAKRNRYSLTGWLRRDDGII